MKYCIIVETKIIENAGNAFQFAETVRRNGHEVKIILMSDAVEWQYISRDQYQFERQLKTFVDAGGVIHAYDMSLKYREEPGTVICPSVTMEECSKIVEWADKTVTF